MTTVLDKQGNPISIHDRPSGWKITPHERDMIYQEFLKAFPTRDERRGILRECLDEQVRDRALKFFERMAKQYPVSGRRIHAFVSEAVAAEEGYLPRIERWDWWVGCSLLESPSAVKSISGVS